MRVKGVLIALILLLALNVASAQNITWYSADYKQKIPITITYSGTEDISDYYQINVTLDGVNYTLTGLLFTDADNETLLPFWNESPLNTKTKVWVNVTGITNVTEKTIWAYINGSDNIFANGDNVFEFFDNFAINWSKQPIFRIFAASDADEITITDPDWENFTQWVNNEYNSSRGLNLVIFNGDLVDDDPSLLDDVKTNYFDPLPVDVFAVVGNHDKTNSTYWETVFGYPTNYVVNLSNYGLDNWVLILYNTTNETGAYLEGNYTWLDEQLTNYADKNVIIAMHIAQHRWSSIDIDGANVSDVLKSHDNVRLVIIGHKEPDYKIYFADGTIWARTGSIMNFKAGYGYVIVEIYDDNSILVYHINKTSNKINAACYIPNIDPIHTHRHGGAFYFDESRKAYLHFYSGAVAYPLIKLSPPFAVETYIETAYDNAGVGWFVQSDLSGYFGWLDWGASKYQFKRYDSGSSTTVAYSTFDGSNNHRFKLVVKNESTAEMFVDDALVLQTTAFSGYTQGNLSLYAGHTSVTGISQNAIFYNFLFARKYTEPEPTATVGTPHYGGSKIGKGVINLIGTNGLIDYGTSYPSELLDMYITPAVDIIKAYDADYDASTNTWTVTVHSDISQPVSFNISTGLANQEFNIYRNGTLYATVTTDANGWLNWTYEGGFSTWVFTFEPVAEEVWYHLWWNGTSELPINFSCTELYSFTEGDYYAIKVVEDTATRKKFYEASNNASLQVKVTVCGLDPSSAYDVKCYWANGTLVFSKVVNSNATGCLCYYTTNFADERYTVIEKRTQVNWFIVVTAIGGALIAGGLIVRRFRRWIRRG